LFSVAGMGKIEIFTLSVLFSFKEQREIFVSLLFNRSGQVFIFYGQNC